MAGALSRLYHFVEDGGHTCGHHLPYPLSAGAFRPLAAGDLILYLLEPFGLSRLESGLLWVSLGAALISAGVSSVFAWALPRMFPRWYAERGWTLGKEVVNTLALLLAIAVCIWIYVACALCLMEPQYPVGKELV